jgi:hypothetical protein
MELCVERSKRRAVGQALGDRMQQQEIARVRRHIGEARLALLDECACARQIALGQRQIGQATRRRATLRQLIGDTGIGHSRFVKLTLARQQLGV